MLILRLRGLINGQQNGHGGNSYEQSASLSLRSSRKRRIGACKGRWRRGKNLGVENFIKAGQTTEFQQIIHYSHMHTYGNSWPIFLLLLQGVLRIVRLYLFIFCSVDTKTIGRTHGGKFTSPSFSSLCAVVASFSFGYGFPILRMFESVCSGRA